jgi:hypothetical protein
MQQQLNLKSTSAKVKDYYAALHQFGQLNISHETAVRQALPNLGLPAAESKAEASRLPAEDGDFLADYRRPQ